MDRHHVRQNRRRGGKTLDQEGHEDTNPQGSQTPGGSMSYFSLSLSFFNSFNYKIQAYLGDIAGSVPDYRDKASPVDFLVSQCI